MSITCGSSQYYTLSTTSTRYQLIYKATIVGNNSALNIGSKGKLAIKPTAANIEVVYPLDKLKITFPNTFNGDCKKLKSYGWPSILSTLHQRYNRSSRQWPSFRALLLIRSQATSVTIYHTMQQIEGLPLQPRKKLRKSSSIRLDSSSNSSQTLEILTLGGTQCKPSNPLDRRGQLLYILLSFSSIPLSLTREIRPYVTATIKV